MLYSRELLLTGVALIFLLFGKNTYAAAGRYVNGTATDSSSQPIVNSIVTVSCLGNILKDQTDTAGVYSVQFDRLSHCLKGSMVTVTAEKNGVSKTITKKMEDAAVIINIQLAYSQPTPPPVSVPEYGLTTAFATAVFAASAYWFTTRSNRKIF